MVRQAVPVRVIQSGFHLSAWEHRGRKSSPGL
jgi:hypothetical protein